MRPAEHEVLASALEAVTLVQQMAGRDNLVRDAIDSDRFVSASVLARIAHLAGAGMHWLCIERPARQAELREVSHAIRGDAPRWSEPFRQVGPPPREPALCDGCHTRLPLNHRQAA